MTASSPCRAGRRNGAGGGEPPGTCCSSWAGRRPSPRPGSPACSRRQADRSRHRRAELNRHGPRSRPARSPRRGDAPADRLRSPWQRPPEPAVPRDPLQPEREDSGQWTRPARTGIVFLGSHALLWLGVMLPVIGLTLQVGATGAVNVVKVSPNCSSASRTACRAACRPPFPTARALLPRLLSAARPMKHVPRAPHRRRPSVPA